LGGWLESVSDEESGSMNLVLKYITAFTAILKRGSSCPQVKAIVSAIEATPETVVETGLTTSLKALAELYPDKAAELATVEEIVKHIIRPTEA